MHVQSGSRHWRRTRREAKAAEDFFSIAPGQSIAARILIFPLQRGQASTSTSNIYLRVCAQFGHFDKGSEKKGEEEPDEGIAATH